MNASPISVPPGLSGTSTQRALRVLVIEDDPNWRLWIESHMQSAGHTVETAADGEAGLAVAARFRPELILCDIEMPGLNGFGVLRAVRSRPALSATPFIFLTSRHSRPDQRQGMSLGADDYLTKPFSREELLAAIAGVLMKRAPLEERLQRYTEEYRRELAAPWAHELLTPLNGILGIASLLEAEPGAVSHTELRELARSIQTSARRQQTLARKLVQYFQLERLRECGWSDPAAASEAAGGIEDEVLGVAERANRTADLQMACVRAAVRVSPQWLRAAAGELADNAFKFSPKGTPVTVSAGPVDGIYRLEVTDRGPGMAAVERAGIAAFRQFGRQQHEQQGLGLGLAIVRNVARLHGGSLTLEALTENAGGLRAMLELPLAD
jgi:two-component system, sensor histidine kinase and response regulator